MLNYNSLIKYNQFLTTYNGVVIIVDQELVVNSETVSTLEIVNVPSNGFGGIELIDQAMFALSSITNDNGFIAGLSVNIDKETSHAVIDLGNSKDSGPEGVFTITIISNI